MGVPLLIGTVNGTAEFLEGTITYSMVGGELKDQVSHNTNLRKLLTDLGLTLP